MFLPLLCFLLLIVINRPPINLYKRAHIKKSPLTASGQLANLCISSFKLL